MASTSAKAFPTREGCSDSGRFLYLLTLSGLELARMIKNQEVTSLEVVEAHIRQIEKVNPTLNALVKDRFDQAREEAKEADRKVRSMDLDLLPPYHGVPFTVKECFQLSGMPNSAGVVARKDVVAEEDAPVVARLRQAGAIPLGVTNVPELCLWIETNNRLYGRTNNPYDADRLVGGSSGGEGAIIAAGGSPFGVGSDMGGSIRLPAFFNGIFSHKPTGGLVPNTGQFPLPGDHPEARRVMTTGPLCRRAEDLMPLLKIMAGPDQKDAGCFEMALGEPDQVKMADLTVYHVEGNGIYPVEKDLLDAQCRCAKHLAQKGAWIRRTKIYAFQHSLMIYAAKLLHMSETSVRELLGNERFSPFVELCRWALKRSPHTLPTIILSLWEKKPFLFQRQIQKWLSYTEELKKRLLDLLGPCGVMLYPSFHRVAPRHNMTFRFPFALVFQAIFNALEFPVTQVPLGLNEEGLPLGVQVISIPGNDHVTIAVAQELEAAFGGWVPPWRKEQTGIR